MSDKAVARIGVVTVSDRAFAGVYEDLGGPVKSSESYWMIEDDELHIQLQKMHKADTWS